MNPSPVMTPAEQRVDRLKSAAVLAMLLVIAGCFIAALRNKNHRDDELAAYPRYTVGEITATGYIVGPNSHSYAKFAYQVGDSTYTGDEDGDLPEGRTRFLVKYSTRHPKYYKFYKRVSLLSNHVPPPEGWAEPPFPVAPEDLE